MSAVTTTHRGDGHEDRQTGGESASASAGAGEKSRSESAEEQLRQLLREAEQARDKAERAARMYHWTGIVALIAHIVSNTLIIGITVTTSVYGGPMPIAAFILSLLSFLTASYSALVRWSREPGRSLLRMDTLELFIRDLQVFMADHGLHVMVDAETKGKEYQRQVEAIMG